MSGQPVSTAYLVWGPILLAVFLILISAAWNGITRLIGGQSDPHSTHSSPSDSVEYAGTSREDPVRSSKSQRRQSPQLTLDATTNLLRRTELPVFDIDDQSPAEALDLLRELLYEQGISPTTLHLTAHSSILESEAELQNMKLWRIPAETALRYLCDDIGCTYTVGEGVVRMVPPKATEDNDPSDYRLDAKSEIEVQRQLNAFIIPTISFHITTLEECVDFLRLEIRKIAAISDTALRDTPVMIRSPPQSGSSSKLRTTSCRSRSPNPLPGPECPSVGCDRRSSTSSGHGGVD